MKKAFYLLLALLFQIENITAQTTITISDATGKFKGDTLYLAGDFNRWNPKDSNYKALRQGDRFIFKGEFVLDIIQLKITQGSWSSCEGDENGNPRTNRDLNLKAQSNFSITIEGWEIPRERSLESTATSNVEILTKHFKIPQLQKTRRVWIYLPPNYYEATDQNYAVVYMHDGQNLFEDTSSYSGEWNIDETLNKRYQEGHEVPIVVGIDNGKQDRVDEYCPWVNEHFGGGEGELYAKFIVETLKPFIDQEYRTKPDLNNTFIGGSSLGGLISHYTILKFPETFGKALVFSPAYYFNTEIFEMVEVSNVKHPIFINMGSLEGEKMVSFFRKMETLTQSEKNVYRLVEKESHNESFWSKEMDYAFDWLLTP